MHEMKESGGGDVITLLLQQHERSYEDDGYGMCGGVRNQIISPPYPLMNMSNVLLSLSSSGQGIE